MIALILGTSEGKEILEKLNCFTEDLFISTATSYGGTLLRNYKYKYINTNPLTKEGLKEKLVDYKISILVDVSHPYALEISENAKSVCKDLNIIYIRYERPSVVEKYTKEKNVKIIENVEALKDEIVNANIKGNILNTTGSNNVDKFLNLALSNRIIHRVLPTTAAVDKCIKMGVAVEDLIAIKGPVSLELNKAFIKEYAAEVMVLKDSGISGGTEEKLKAAIEENIIAYVIKRKEKNIEENNFKNINVLVEYIKNLKQ